jgi:PTH1 family peptidyl-tRNA hydrolase
MIPETFMNLSGRAVAPFARRKGIAVDRILVLVDDLYLMTGKIRIRPSGSSAGHNGLRSIEESLGSNEYPRIRIGIGPDPGGDYRTRYVLSRPRPEVLGDYLKGQETALGAAELVMEKGVATAMNVFNA